VTKVNAVEATEILRQGGVMLTATPRQAADWKRRYAEASARTVSETPCIWFWEEWLHQLAASVPDAPVALTRLQEAQLWERVIAGSDPALPADSRRGLAGLAAETWSLLRQYRIPQQELTLGGEEAAAFERWATAMQKRLAGPELAGRLLADDLPHWLMPHIRTFRLPKRMLLVGFDHPTPLQQWWLGAITASGVTVLGILPESPAAHIDVVECLDEQAELAHVAGRLGQWLGEDAGMRIGVLCPDLESRRGELLRVLDTLLLPDGGANPSGELQSVQWPPERLGRQPLVRQVLQLLLHAGEGFLPYSEFSPLLFLPWLKGFAAESTARAALDVRLRRYNRHGIALKEIVHGGLGKELPALAEVLGLLGAWERKPRPAAEWVQAVHQLLQEVGLIRAERVPGEERSAAEVRCVNAFRDVLASMVALDAVAGPLGWNEFLTALRSSCERSRLAARVRYPNVSVLAPEDAVGMRFDRLLVMGMDEETLPAAPRAHPLLPLAVQQRYGVPGCDGRSAFEASHRLWDGIAQAAPHIEACFARRKGDRELLPSPLLASASSASPCSDGTSAWPSLPMQAYEDAPAVPLQSREQVRGGTAIVKNQSDCPFRALAVHRLDCRALEATEPGINAAGKGSLMHLALEYIWRRLGAQEALLALSDDGLEALLEAATAAAWDGARVAAEPLTRDIEQKRMRRVLREWLEIEKQRPPFTVAALEEDFELLLPQQGGVRFVVRIKADRLDRDDQGRTLLFDYKTGSALSRSAWLAGRLEEPQLPIYFLAASAAGKPPVAVAFARVRSGECGFQGLASEDVGIEEIRPYEGVGDGQPDDWPALISQWREAIDMLAGEFVAGRCDVTPREAGVCQFCGLQPLCRIDEIGMPDDGEEAA
jgi:ATP-dependent helicase/nuclease subunit B